MYSSAKQGLLLIALLTGMLLNSACENDLNKIKEISAQQLTSAIDSTTNIDIIYSDSARVKLHMTAPLLLQHEDIKHPENAYEEMPHGVRIVFYDTTRKESGTIVADSAISHTVIHTVSKIIEFHKNVVATNPAGDTYKSDELIWDQVKKTIYSNKWVQITRKAGDTFGGIPFTDNEKLDHPVFGSSNGLFHVADTTMN